MDHDDLGLMAHRPGLVWGYDFADGGAEPLSDADLDSAEASPRGFRWLHFNLSDQRTQRWLAAASLPAGIAAMFASVEREPRYLLDGGMLGLVLHDIEYDFSGGEPRIAVLQAAVGPSLIITGRRHPVRAAESLKRRIERGARPADGMAALDLLFAAQVEVFRDLTTELEAQVQRIEDDFLADRAPPDAKTFINIRSLMVRLRRLYGAMRTMLRRLEEDPDAPAPYAEEAARLIARLSALDSDLLAVQSQLRLLRDELDLQAAQQTNRNLYVLSVLTALLMPATVVTGIFGMNTGGLIWASDHHGSLWATALAVGSAAVTYLALRLSGFIRR